MAYFSKMVGENTPVSWQVGPAGFKKRTQKIKHGGNSLLCQFPADWSNQSKGRMIERGEEKSDAGLMNTISHLFRRAGNRNSKIFEHISGTRLGSDRLVPVLQHHHTGRREQEYACRRDVDQFKTIATSSDNIDRWSAFQLKGRPDRQFQKGASKISKFFPGFPLYFQGHQEIAFFELGNVRIGKLSRSFARLIHPEINPVSQLFDKIFQRRVPIVTEPSSDAFSSESPPPV